MTKQRPGTARRATVFIAVACATAICAAQQPTLAARSSPDPKNPWRVGRTLVIPHGGGDGLYPEDTMYAYEHTMAMGADVVDVDVQLSADNIPVVIHDGSVTRTTGGRGDVHAMTVAGLQQLDAGYSFTLNGLHPFRGKGLQIPTLEQVLERFPNVLLSIDLKDERNDIIDPMCTLLRRYHRTRDAFVGSNADNVILTFRKRCPEVRTSAVMPDVYAARNAQASNDASFRW